MLTALLVILGAATLGVGALAVLGRPEQQQGAGALQPLAPGARPSRPVTRGPEAPVGVPGTATRFIEFRIDEYKDSRRHAVLGGGAIGTTVDVVGRTESRAFFELAGSVEAHVGGELVRTYAYHWKRPDGLSVGESIRVAPESVHEHAAGLAPPEAPSRAPEISVVRSVADTTMTITLPPAHDGVYQLLGAVRLYAR